MKLIVKTSIYYIGFSIIGFIIGGFIFYHVIFSIINSNANRELITEKELIEEQIFYSDSIPDFTPFFGHQIMVTIYDHEVSSTLRICDTIILSTTEGETVPIRYLISYNNKAGKSYSIEILKPLINSNQLIKDIFFVMFIMFLFLLMSLIIINYIISKNTWSTFYTTLKKLKDYDINSENGLVLNQTTITEFAQLNNVLLHMSDKIYKNYVNLKEFTENASHEIQTPLAIVKSKLELLIQGQKLNEEQIGIIQSIYQAINRLSKLNANLVLLSKIENSQFQESRTVNLQKLIQSILENLEDLIAQKELIIDKNIISHPVEITINPTLAEVLIVNLISNAIKHNIKNGKIQIVLNDNYLSISNNGNALSGDPETMFNRFKKGTSISESLGLGLSLVKKIADIYQMNISYTFKDGIHVLTLKFVR
jgi:signal transduction histidine kinase